MRHTAVVLPLDLFERLQRDAESSGRGLSGEIRECLHRRADRETEQFIAAVKKLGELVERDLGRDGTDILTLGRFQSGDSARS